MSTYHELNFQAPIERVTSKSPVWRPPSFPPSGDWPVTIDAEGGPLSHYSDDFWDFRQMVSKRGAGTFNFGIYSLSDENKDLVKRVMIFIMYHPRLFPGSISGCLVPFRLMAKIAKICSEKGILISQLSRFEGVHQEVAGEALSGSASISFGLLYKLLAYSDKLGFVIADEKTLAYFASQIQEHVRRQHPYIPPRIWGYVVNRLNDILDQFLVCQDRVERAFDWLDGAYSDNLEEGVPKRHISPFAPSKACTEQQRIVYEDGFDAFLKTFGLWDQFDSILGRTEYLHAGCLYRPQDFGTYLNLARNVALTFILLFTMQRRSEVESLRSDCFVVEGDEKLGSIGMIIGETTKTDPDSDARWVVPLYVRKAVDVASFIAKLRMRHFPEKPEDLRQNPYLAAPGGEPWQSGLRPSQDTVILNNFIFKDLPTLNLYSLLDLKEMAVTEEDWRAACALTPDLPNRPEFGIAKVWKLTAHQFRRTLAVNLFSSESVSLPSIQWAMKHMSRHMSLYYGRNYTNLRFSSAVERVVLFERYKSIYRRISEIANDVQRHVQPHGREMLPEKVVNLVEARDETKLTKLIKKGQVGCRKTRVGFCMKGGICEYGGIESIAHCVGYDGKGICADARFDRKREPELLALKEQHEKELEALGVDGPRFNYLKAEIYAIEVFESVIQNQDS